MIFLKPLFTAFISRNVYTSNGALGLKGNFTYFYTTEPNSTLGVLVVRKDLPKQDY